MATFFFVLGLLNAVLVNWASTNSKVKYKVVQMSPMYWFAAAAVTKYLGY